MEKKLEVNQSLISESLILQLALQGPHVPVQSSAEFSGLLYL